MTVEALFFDFDGVLVESVNIKTAAFAKLFERYGPHVVKGVVEYHEKNLGVSRFKKFEYYFSELIHETLTPELSKELDRQFSALVMEEVIRAPWVSGAEKFLMETHEMVPLFVVSGTPQAELEGIVERRRMSAYFREIHGAPRVKGEIIRDILQRKKYRPERTAMIGDALTDLLGARANPGVRFVGVDPLRKTFLGEEVPVVDDLSELRETLKSVFSPV